MGDVNVQTKDYMRDNAKFADLCNYYLYDGQERIVAEDLQELDVTELVSVLTEKGVVMQEKLRDLLKLCTVKTADDVVYFLVGIENQTDIHYAMVVRNLLMDAMNYSNQADALAKKHRSQKDLKGEEFLSGFSKTDKLTPVITITVYWGPGDWDGPRTLHEMLDCPPELLAYVPDYKLNLVVPREISDFSKLHTELRDVLEIITSARSSSGLSDYFEKNPGVIVSNEAGELMNSLLNLGIPLRKGEGGINMCEALKELIEESRLEGREEGRAEMLAKIVQTSVSDDIILSLGYSEEEIKEARAEFSIRTLL